MKSLIYSILIALLFGISALPEGIQNRKSNEQPSNYSAVYLPKYFYKRFEGKIDNKYSIVMNLIRRDTVINGNYYYEDKGIPIYFNYNSRIDNNDSIYLGEETGRYDSSYMPISSGVFKGKFINAHEIKGYWEKPGSKNIMDFSLEEKYPSGSASLEIKRFSKEYKKDSLGANIEFIYPVLANYSNNEIGWDINSNIEKTFLKDYNFGERNINWKSYDAMMDDFVKRYKNFINDTSLSKDYKPMWENSFFTDVIFNSNDILSLENTEFHFEGGAHPLTFFIYVNYNLKTGKAITLNDLLVPNYKAELDKIGESEFRKTYNVKKGERFETAGYFIKNNDFHLNNNFSITKAGLVFRFGQYEIGPYVMGAPSVFIPYNEIKSLINQEGLLGQFVK